MLPKKSFQPTPRVKPPCLCADVLLYQQPSRLRVESLVHADDWGPCPGASGSSEQCADRDLGENCECRDTLTDLIENGTSAEEANARCWLEHYLRPTSAVDRHECDPSLVTAELSYFTFAEADLNYNGIPDACEGARGDVDGDGDVDFTDLLALLAAWGDCPPGEFCPADVDLSGGVGFTDLVALLSNWT